MKKLVHKTLADSPMTGASKRKLARVAARPDSEIDVSEIPPLTESFWKNATTATLRTAEQAVIGGTSGDLPRGVSARNWDTAGKCSRAAKSTIWLRY